VDNDIEAVFAAWEEWRMEFEGPEKIALQARFFSLVSALAEKKELKNADGSPMSPFDFMRLAGKRYAAWSKRPH
jgi:hypothetical protein